MRARRWFAVWVMRYMNESLSEKAQVENLETSVSLSPTREMSVKKRKTVKFNTQNCEVL